MFCPYMVRVFVSYSPVIIDLCHLFKIRWRLESGEGGQFFVFFQKNTFVKFKKKKL